MMNKKIISTGLVMLLLFVFAGLIYAADKGNGRKGKYLFRKSCRSCHVENGSAKELSPISKTQEQWKEAFADDAYKKFACADEWEKKSEKDLLDIFTYMYDHAFDSPSPAKCK